MEFSGTDESQTQWLLTSIIAHSILPRSLNGCELDVVLISTNHKFNIIKLVGVIEQKVKLSANDAIDRELLDSILDRLHVFDAGSSSDCCMALMNLLHFPSNYGKVGAVIIDDIGVLSWESKGFAKKELKAGDCADIVKKLVQEYTLLVVFSHVLPLASDGHCIKPLLKLVNYRFRLHSEGAQIQIQQKFPDNGKLYKFDVSSMDLLPY